MWGDVGSAEPLGCQASLNHSWDQGRKREKGHALYKMVGCRSGVTLLVRIKTCEESLNGGKARLVGGWGACSWDAPARVFMPATSSGDTGVFVGTGLLHLFVHASRFTHRGGEWMLCGFGWHQLATSPGLTLTSQMTWDWAL